MLRQRLIHLYLSHRRIKNVERYFGAINILPYLIIFRNRRMYFSKNSETLSVRENFRASSRVIRRIIRTRKIKHRFNIHFRNDVFYHPFESEKIRISGSIVETYGYDNFLFRKSSIGSFYKNLSQFVQKRLGITIVIIS